MLNFRNTNILFVLMLAILIGLQLNFGWSFYFYLPLIVIYSFLVFYGCYYVGSNFFIDIPCKGKTNKKEIAISFDDGPTENYTPQILDILKTSNIKATFFCIGNRITGNEKLLLQIYTAGHIIGNHSFSHHLWFDLFSAQKMQNDLKQMDDELERVIGVKPKLFRPPYGVTNPNVKKAIQKGGYSPVGWSVRSMDTVIKDEQKLLSKINKGIKPGAVFLFHDTSKTTMRVLPEFIKEVKKQGYNIIPLDKMLALKAYA